MERALEGVSAAPGLAIGPATVLDRPVVRAERHVPLAARPLEKQRALDALNDAASDLQAIARTLRLKGRDAEAEIVETGMLMAADPLLVSRIEMLITDAGIPAPQALRRAADEAALELDRLPDPMLALRADDLRSLGRRAATRAAGITQRPGEVVLIASTLGPADVAEFATLAAGIALARGGVTSHAAIVARSLGLPMVVGLGDDVLDLDDGRDVVVDGDHGGVFIDPSPTRISSARADGERRRAAREEAIARRSEPAETVDGHRVRVLANASTLAELDEALGQGAEGVGLMRTELLFLEATGWPTLRQQINVLRPVMTHLAGEIATVRLFDFGGDKTPPFLRGSEKRGIDVLLDVPDKLRMHLAAIIDAGRGTRLRILVPMVTTPRQMRLVRQAVAEGAAQVGAMIETPEAAAAATAIAGASDFLSIGTNDLTQLALGLDREHSRRAPVLDRRVLSMIAETVRAAHSARIPVDVCGEAASDASALPIMVGLGVDELSIAPARVGVVRQWIRDLDYAAAEKEAAALLHQPGHAARERA